MTRTIVPTFSLRKSYKYLSRTSQFMFFLKQGIKRRGRTDVTLNNRNLKNIQGNLPDERFNRTLFAEPKPYQQSWSLKSQVTKALTKENKQTQHTRQKKQHQHQIIKRKHNQNQIIISEGETKRIVQLKLCMLTSNRSIDEHKARNTLTLLT